MSMELLVFLALEKTPNVAAWNDALRETGVPVQISASVDLSKHSGFLPMKLGDENTGLYFLTEEYADLAAQIPELSRLPFEKIVVFSLGYGGDFKEGAAVFYSASALVAKFEGVAFDTQGGQFMTVAELLDAAKQLSALAP